MRNSREYLEARDCRRQPARRIERRFRGIVGVSVSVSVSTTDFRRLTQQKISNYSRKEVTQIFTSWNQIAKWLSRLDLLRRAA